MLDVFIRIQETADELNIHVEHEERAEAYRNEFQPVRRPHYAHSITLLFNLLLKKG
jgi:hypothetical protein